MTQARLLLTIVLTALIAGCNAIDSITVDGGADPDIQITSEPPGATVYLMDTKAGVTPMVVNERDLYPVSYTPETEKYYGKIILRKEGCKEFSRRLTRSDVYKGLVARLDCHAGATNEPVQEPLPEVQSTVVSAPVPAKKPHPEDPVPAPSAPEQQLEQLRILQQLQDAGVLTEDEEKKLRKRILSTP